MLGGSAVLAQDIQALSKSNLVGVLADKSLGLYVGILSIILSGKGYVPLNPKFPKDRINYMIAESGVDTIVCDSSLAEVVEDLKVQFPQVNFITISCSPKNTDFKFEYNRSEESLCYLLFTSGSTGKPKGVSINELNLNSYLDYILETYKYRPEDRVIQTFDANFDLSVHDIFVTWLSGACLYPLTGPDLYFPGHFVKKHKISIWFSVPSLAMIMSKMKQVTESNLSSLRLSLFCGEALPTSVVSLWKEASHSDIFNFYGPTEATIAILDYSCSSIKNNDSLLATTPIGKPFKGHLAQVLSLDGEKLSLIHI